MRLKRIFQLVVGFAADLGEVELEHHVAIGVFRRVLAEPESAEELFEVLLLAQVVVALHHGDEERLAESARADEEDEAVQRLHLREVFRLVHIVKPLVSDSPEIRNAVWNPEIDDFSHGALLVVCAFNSSKEPAGMQSQPPVPPVAAFIQGARRRGCGGGGRCRLRRCGRAGRPWGRP